eukprot:CAMPEP_0198284072 /NCGR_PEP_ID=MMETSP1449-20131203/3598_1 /TAXON_ID=420275 /ORGANISM="Attheya septentrionalis, Strain CCMP2084" /LENGTH=572 /DNA_ID=CAMNT_0043980987 /DNA_START=86 /DNA_END=1807 /DNA_ORIENTATION=-
MATRYICQSMTIVVITLLLCTFINGAQEQEGDIAIAGRLSSAFSPGLYSHLWEPYSSMECLPRHIHLSLGNTESSVMISCSLPRTENCGPDSVTPIVILGRDSNHAFPSTPEQIKITTKYGFTSTTNRAHYESRWIHHIEVLNLELGDHKYWYRIEVLANNKTDSVNSGSSHIMPDFATGDSDGGWQASSRLLRRQKGMKNNLQANLQTDTGKKEEKAIVASTSPRTFRTPPHVAKPVQIAIVGDLGQTTNSTKTMYHMMKTTRKRNQSKNDDIVTSLILCAGDMSYANSNQELWANWFDVMEPLFSGIPLLVTAGNHEIECNADNLDIFVPYEKWFRMPNRLGEAIMEPVDPNYKKSLWDQSCSTPSAFLGRYDYGNAFYAVTHGLVRIITLSSYSQTLPGSRQEVWLNHELAQLNRTVTPWVIVMYHAPFYTTFRSHNDEIQSILMHKSMETLFLKYRVNIIVNGHDHAYMRTHPIVANLQDPENPTVDVTGKAPIHITVGAGGNREGHVKEYLNATMPEPWVAKRNKDEYGFGTLHVRNCTHAYWSWIRDGKTSKGFQDEVWFDNQYFL